jgi:hypothetical protein
MAIEMRLDGAVDVKLQASVPPAVSLYSARASLAK